MKTTLPSTPVNENISSGDHLSFWFMESIQPLAFETLNHAMETDVLVIGGGIAGLTTAYCLAKAGRKVVLVEDGYIGSGETGRTTAHITCALDDRYYELEATFGKEKAQLAANSHSAAIEWIAHTVKKHQIECHFKRVDGYLFLHGTDNKENLLKEYEATKHAGLMTEMLDHVPCLSAEEGAWSIKFKDQAQFHILLYLKGLANAFIELGGKIYTETKAEEINSKGAMANGFHILANHIVVATNTPSNDWVTMHTKQWPYRSYVIAAKIPKGTLPFALWWDTGDQKSHWIAKPYHYARLAEYDEMSDMLIVGGQDHRTGQADEEHIKEEDRYYKLIEWAQKRFPAMGAVNFKWSGQVMEPVDSLGYIGKNPGNDNIYIITGDSGNGMTNGTLGGMIITDIITGKDNPWIDLYSPSRITLKTSDDYLHEVGNMIAQFADWFTPADINKTKDLKIGEGTVLTSGLKKIAAYRDSDNKLHLCSGVCPHLGGVLQWNADEKTFDCPLHGSRFTAEGKVVNGPATGDLKKIIPSEERGTIGS